MKIPVTSFLFQPTNLSILPVIRYIYQLRDLKQFNPPWKGLTLAVVPEFSTSANIVKFPERDKSEKRVFYYPETRGLSITGKLTDNRTGECLPDTRINLSIIGKGTDFMAMQTDSAGRFFFSLPDYTGSRDLFLCAENIGHCRSENFG